jgi:cysteinyl-tRNA synthetase
MTSLEGAFVAALEGGGIRDGVGALLDLDSAIEARIRAGEDSPDLDNASATFRALIVRLGERASAGSVDAGPAAEPLVAALLEIRDAARAGRDWATADLIRDRLAEAGLEIRDEAGGVTVVPGSQPR